MTQATDKKTAKSRRQKMTVAKAWKMWMDNLRAWQFYIEEHKPQDLLHISLLLSKTGKKCGEFFRSLRRDLRHQRRETRRRHFPESEIGLAQLCLFFAGSLPRIGAAVTSVFRHRRMKRISGGKGNVKSGEHRLHPVAFLSGALVVVGICAVLSFYTVGTTATYDGAALGTVSGFNAVSAVVEDVETITRETLQDQSYRVDEAKLDTVIGVVPRSEVDSKEVLAENLSEELGVVDYGYTIVIDGEPIAATTFAGALEELLDQMTRSYVTADTVEC